MQSGIQRRKIPLFGDDPLILDRGAIVHSGTDAATMDALLTAAGRK
jgi:hypothetical protein